MRPPRATRNHKRYPYTQLFRSDLEKGDLVFFNTRGSRYSHVGIYLGDGKFVHAPRTGASVRVESMHISDWKKRYNGARRLAAHDVIHTSDNRSEAHTYELQSLMRTSYALSR